ncbi:MAG: hypothetical protein ACK4MX_06400 [Thermaurantiacus sp.]
MRSRSMFLGRLVAGFLLAAGGTTIAQEAPPLLPDGRLDVVALQPAGKPRSCVPRRDVQESRPFENSAIMFRTGANRWLRNDLKDTCPALDRNRALVFRSPVGQMCENDIVDVVDPVSKMNWGFCTLGQFTPVSIPRGSRF